MKSKLKKNMKWVLLIGVLLLIGFIVFLLNATVTEKRNGLVIDVNGEKQVLFDDHGTLPISDDITVPVNTYVSVDISKPLLHQSVDGVVKKVEYDNDKYNTLHNELKSDMNDGKSVGCVILGRDENEDYAIVQYPNGTIYSEKISELPIDIVSNYDILDYKPDYIESTLTVSQGEP